MDPKINMKFVVYDDEISTLNLIFEEYPKGGLSVLCPVCNETVTVVLDTKDVEKHELGPGIYCKNNHVRSLFNFRGKQ